VINDMSTRTKHTYTHTGIYIHKLLCLIVKSTNSNFHCKLDNQNNPIRSPK